MENKFRKIISFAAILLLAVAAMSSCKKNNDSPSSVDVKLEGSWHLVEIGKVTKAEEPYGISVYITFSQDATFDLYQKMQEGRYVHYSGQWERDRNTLYGFYSDGSPLGAGSYEISSTGTDLRLKALNGSDETNVYEKAVVPEDVISNAVEGINP